jgi:hypothetical protein
MSEAKNDFFVCEMAVTLKYYFRLFELIKPVKKVLFFPFKAKNRLKTSKQNILYKFQLLPTWLLRRRQYSQ